MRNSRNFEFTSDGMWVERAWYHALSNFFILSGDDTMAAMNDTRINAQEFLFLHDICTMQGFTKTDTRLMAFIYVKFFSTADLSLL